MVIPPFLKEHARIIQRFFPGLRNKFPEQGKRSFRYEHYTRNNWEQDGNVHVAGKPLPIFIHYRYAF